MWNIAITLLVAVQAFLQTPQAGQIRWFKGNTHVHTWHSDGDSPPEVVAAWYKQHGYHFLVLTDHNSIDDHSRWEPCLEGKRQRGVEAYERMFGPDWVEKEVREKDGRQVPYYRIKTLDEIRPLFEEPGRFLLIAGDEISEGVRPKKGRVRPVHCCAINLRQVVQAQTGPTVRAILESHISSVLAQEAEYGIPMLVHVNHPNFGYAITPEDLAAVENATFFEVFNGHPSVRNHGNEKCPSTDRIWDCVLAYRLGERNLPLLYGVATDDAHNFATGGKGSSPGRGWIMVRARYLTPTHLIRAMKRGDFYASTGVVLRDVRFDGRTLSIEITPRDGVQYTTQFIGTRTGAQADEDVGRVLAEQTGLVARYTMTGDELYVRAKVISTARHPNPFAKGDVEVAWTQPVLPGQRTTSP